MNSLLKFSPLGKVFCETFRKNQYILNWKIKTPTLFCIFSILVDSAALSVDDVKFEI